MWKLFTVLLVSLGVCVDANAAVGTVGGRTPIPQIFYNIVTNAGAACNGDVLTVTRTASITTGTKNLAVTVNTFTSGDVGKAIVIPGAGSGSGTYFGNISTFTDAQHVVLSVNAATTLAAVSTAFTYGTDDAPAFDTFNNWARANQGTNNQVVLTVPTGRSCWFGSGTFNYVPLFNAFAAGINNLIVEGTGATLSSVGGRSFQLAGLGVCQAGLTAVNGCSARIQTANAGDTTVSLTSASFSAGYISRFTVGQWIMLGGMDIQGLFQSAFGFPPNQQYFEWRQITAVNTGTGVITLDRPLTNTYRSTWANYNSGSNFEADNGGPATIWYVGTTLNTWNTTVEYRGLTISQDGQTYAQGRNVTYRNVAFTGANGGIPTQNETWSAINSTFTNVSMETDKLVGTMLMDGVTISQIIFQSSSTDNFIMKNSTVTLELGGGAKTSAISDSTLAKWGPGFFGYGGTSGAQTCTRCTITTMNTEFAGNYFTDATGSFFMSSGLITMPNSRNGQQALVPGNTVLLTTSGYFTTGLLKIGSSLSSVSGDGWPAVDNQTVTTNVTMNCSTTPNQLDVSGSIFASGDVGKVIIIPGAKSGPQNLNTFITAFTSATRVSVFDACTQTQSAVSQQLNWGTSNTYAQTTSAGGFPNLSSLGTGISFRVKGSSNFTCDTCNAGSPNTDAYGVSVQAGATPGAPLASYITRTFTPTSAQGNLDTLPIRGKILSLTIDVTTPYSGVAGSVTMNATGQFHLFGVDQAAYTQYDWVPQINLKQAGKRIITPSGTTCNGVTGSGPGGSCAGDACVQPASGCFAPPATLWVPQNITPFMGSGYSGGTAPVFTVTAQTNQSP